MRHLVRAKLALFIIGLILWTWGYRSEDSYFRIAGIVVLAIAFLLRFVGRRPRAPDPPKDGTPSP